MSPPIVIPIIDGYLLAYIESVDQEAWQTSIEPLQATTSHERGPDFRQS
jgi:hypothetical protein